MSHKPLGQILREKIISHYKITDIETNITDCQNYYCVLIKGLNPDINNIPKASEVSENLKRIF